MSLHRRVLCMLFFTLAASSLLAQTPTQVSVTTGQGGSVLSAPGLSETAPYAPSRVIVRFQPGAAADKLPGAASSRVLSRSLNMHLVDVPPGLTVSQAVGRYKNNPNVIYAEPDYTVSVGTTLPPNDTNWGQQWDMVNISALSAWQTQTNAGNVVVAIVDTGVNFSHEDLLQNIWVNSDGTHGFNCIGGVCMPGGEDDHGHGTHVAGTIGAVGNNGKGIAGINWNVKIAAFKFLNSGGSGSISDAIAAFEKIRDLIQINHVNIRVTNNSWGGGGYSQGLKDAMLAVEALGAVNVCAAGNSGVNADVAPMYPGAFDNRGIISVIATDSVDAGAGFSNYGFASTDIAAPGVATLSTVPPGPCALCAASGYNTLSGTSMATPHVTGVVAAMMQINPSLTPAQARDIVTDPGSYDWMTNSRAQSTSSGGRLNFDKVIHNAKLLSPAPLNNFPSVTMGADVVAPSGGSVTVSAAASDPDSSDALRVALSKVSASSWLFGWMMDSLFPTPSGASSTFNVASLARAATQAYLGSAADNRGGGASATQLVTVLPMASPGSPPTGVLTASSNSAPVGTTLTFNYAVTDPDNSGTPAWDLWASGTNGATGSCCFTGSSASMQFQNAGVYRVSTQAVDRRLDLSTRSTTVVRIGGATGEPPLASAVLDKVSGTVPLTVNINMSGSSDADGSISYYFFGCGGGYAPPSSGALGSCVFTTPGTYWLLLQVQDNSGNVDLLSAYVVATPAGGGGGGGGGGGTDVTPPTVNLTSPADGATVSGVVAVSATASDASGISKVEFYRDGNVLIGTATVPVSGVYSVNWNTAGQAGPHTLFAIATDGAGNTAPSSSRSVTVPAPPPSLPTVTISSPTGSTVARKATVNIAALPSATAPATVSRVEFYVNSALTCTDSSSAGGYTCAWKVPAAPNKTYSLFAVVYDSFGQSGTSPVVMVRAP